MAQSKTCFDPPRGGMREEMVMSAVLTRSECLGVWFVMGPSPRKRAKRALHYGDKVLITDRNRTRASVVLEIQSKDANPR